MKPLNLSSEIIEKDIERILQSLKDRSASFEDKNVVITGGAGFLGSWVSEVLVRDGATVICVDDFSTGKLENVVHLKEYRNFKIIKADISSHDFLSTINSEVPGNIDYIFHMASPASPFLLTQMPIHIIKTNTLGTYNILELARKKDATVLFASSSEIYGEPEIIPTPEHALGRVDSTNERGVYTEGKRAGEALSLAYYREYDLDVRIARIFNTYGPRMRGDGSYGRVISRFILQALKGEPLTVFGDGSQTRSFCYVSDMVTGLILLALTPNLAGEVINLGSPEEIKIIELARLIIQLIGTSEEIVVGIPPPPGDVKRRCPDISKARKLLNWEPQTSLEKGLKKTIEYYKTCINK